MIIPQGTLETNYSEKPYQKIISLVPSISWMLFDFQLQKNIIGITKFCRASNNQDQNYIKVGGTKNPDLKKIIELKPDLILANKEENRKEDIEELATNQIVYLSDIKDLESMYIMMKDISKLTHTHDIALNYIEQIKTKHILFDSNLKTYKNSSAAYLIWKNPYMTIGSDTFIHYMLQLSGFENSFKDRNRYPEITLDELIQSKPDFVLLSSEPYPFTKKHLIEFNPLKARLVDGRIFSWYGTFILQSFDYLNAFKKSINSNL